MLRITTETKRGKLFLSVEGSLSGPRVATLEQCWRELYATSPRPKFFVNLCGVSFIDNAGKVLLKEMHRLGAELLAEGCLNQAIVTEIISAGDKTTNRETKDGESSKGSSIIFYIIFFSLLLSPAFTFAQTQTPSLPATAPDGVLKLTLQQAVALAIKQNPTQQIAVLNAAESIQDKNITRSDLLPQANLHVADSANRVNLVAQFGGNVPPYVSIPGTYRALSDFLRRPQLRQQCHRSLALEALPGGPQQCGCQQGQQSLHPRAGDLAGRLAVHWHVTRRC